MLPPPLTPMAVLRYDVVRRHLARWPDVRDVLEVGAGQGALGARLAVRYSYTGLEPDARSAAVASRRLAEHGRGRLLEGTAQDLAEAERFDLVCAFEVLEHLEDDRGALAAWAARLRPGGRLLVSVPAHAHRWSVTDELVGHVRRYEPGALPRLLGEVGLVGAGETLYGMPAGYLLEGVRGWLTARRDAGPIGTAGSGRLHQPSAPALGVLTEVALAPAALAQRPFAGTRLGTGIVAVARRPL